MGSLSPKNKLNDLTSTEWIAETVSVWIQKGLGANHKEAQIEKLHPAPFSFQDIGRLVRFFTKRGGVVLDPMVGVGSTLKACVLNERNGIGFELSPYFSELAQQRLREEVPTDLLLAFPQRVLTGDARKLIHQIEDNSVDFVVTSPPYWNILHKEDHKVRSGRISKNLRTVYSDDNLDFGNIASYEDFLHELGLLFNGCSAKLKLKKYMAVIVGDFRDKSKYYMFHADLACELERLGWGLRGITILYQNHKRVFPYGYPAAYVPNIHHQYILIFQNERSLT